MEIPEQAMELDLPTLLVDASGSAAQLGYPGVGVMGYLAAEGKVRVGLVMGCRDDDPTQVTVTLRLLEASYSVPAGCSPRARETILRVNQELNARLLGEISA